MHHAYLYRGQEPFSLSGYAKFFPDNSHISHRHYDTIGIPEVRAIIREVILTVAGESAHHVLILEAGNLTNEAEQAMLKVFEDPRPGVSLVLILPPGYQLIATLRSRFYELPVVNSDEVVSEFLTFKDLSYAARLEMISDRLNKKDSQWVDAIKKGLLVWLGQAHGQDQVELLSFVVTHLKQRGASNKLLLEELALTLRIGKKC
jgi:hypothetical protein